LSGLPAELAAELQTLRDRFQEAMDDDFNTGAAVASLFEFRKAINGYIAQQKLETAASPEQLEALTTSLRALLELARVLGVFRQPVAKAGGGDDALVQGLMSLILELRADARREKNWAAADKIRDQLKALQITVEDVKDGPARWSRS
jgi:cysteinyl-tRNA synthetase